MSVFVETLADLKAVNTTTTKEAYLKATGRAGQFIFKAGNLANQVTADPKGGIYVAPNSDPSGASGAWFRAEWTFDSVKAMWFGYDGNNNAAVDDAPALQAAINFLENQTAAAHGGHFGGFVELPIGVGFLGSTIVLTNRVGVRGPNGRAAWLKPHSSFAAARMFHCVNGTTSQFGVELRDLFIDARGKSMTEVILAEAWQESCGMKRVAISFDGSTISGVHLANGYGGASYTLITDCEIFGDSSHPASAGIRVSQVSSVGAFMLDVRGLSVTGSAAHRLTYGIRIDKDSLCGTGLHFEYVVSCIDKDGPGSLSLDTVTGSYNAVDDIVSFAGSNTGAWSLRAINPNGATGYSVRFYSGSYPNKPASAGTVPNYAGP